MWRCQCSCAEGTIKAIQGDSLTMKKTQSCGCLIDEVALPAAWKASRKHGYARGHKPSPAWRSWSSMFTRCYNPQFKDYRHYGGRGIVVCARWIGKEGFQCFLADMGERPKGTSLDRYPDMNGNYEPSNCRWATPSEQSRNTRKSKLTMDLVQEMHGRYEHGERIASISRRVRIDSRQINAVVHGKTWKDAVGGYPLEHLKTPKRKDLT